MNMVSFFPSLWNSVMLSVFKHSQGNFNTLLFRQFCKQWSEKVKKKKNYLLPSINPESQFSNDGALILIRDACHSTSPHTKVQIHRATLLKTFQRTVTKNEAQVFLTEDKRDRSSCRVWPQRGEKINKKISTQKIDNGTKRSEATQSVHVQKFPFKTEEDETAT